MTISVIAFKTLSFNLNCDTTKLSFSNFNIILLMLLSIKILKSLIGITVILSDRNQKSLSWLSVILNVIKISPWYLFFLT